MTWQPAALVYPDIEEHLCQELGPILALNFGGPVYVSRRVQKPRKANAVVVTRDGGALGEVRDRPRVRFRVWHNDDEKAADLAGLIVGCLPLLVGNGTVLRVEHLSGPLEVAEPSGDQLRYLLYEIHTRPVRQLS